MRHSNKCPEQTTGGKDAMADSTYRNTLREVNNLTRLLEAYGTTTEVEFASTDELYMLIHALGNLLNNAHFVHDMAKHSLARRAKATLTELGYTVIPPTE